jgi:small-conductance mechanosensitive channel
MDYLALGVGVLFGLVYLQLSQAIDWILVVLHYMFFRSKENFYGLYDNTEQESVYEYLKYTETLDVRDYADYLRLHQAARPSAYKRFRKYYDALVKVLLVRVAPITLLPAILFWSNWYYYVEGLLIAFIVLALYAIIVKPRGAGARKRLMVFAVMRDYLKDNKKTK